MIEPSFSALQRVRSNRPLLHCISNMVTIQDCANLALAVGARPVMAQEPAEMAEIAGAAAAVVLNTGTPGQDKFAACALAGGTANAMGKPVVLDPVGAGASAWRRARLEELLCGVRPTLVRANLAEVQALLKMRTAEAGVDSVADVSDKDALNSAVHLARKLNCVVLLSGETDYITDGKTAFAARGGSPRMSRITGAGCMLSVLAAAFLSQSSNPLQACTEAAAFWKACGTYAEAEVQKSSGGMGVFHSALFDAADLLTGAECGQFYTPIEL